MDGYNVINNYDNMIKEIKNHWGYKVNVVLNVLLESVFICPYSHDDVVQVVDVIVKLLLLLTLIL